MDETEAQAALTAMEQANEWLAGAMDCPPWRHAAFGAVMAAIVAAAGFREYFIFFYLPAMLGVVLLVRSDRRRTGTFVNGWRRGKTLPLSIVLMGVMLVLIFAEIHARLAGLSAGTRISIGGVAFAIATAASVIFQRIYLAELRKDLRS